ncbi:MAG TPA: hypothetical protein VGQ26_27915 [Streptosporangiaceae bacterium]|nr:hypothetical protein [Streptosporangiaceae bacterium]
MGDQDADVPSIGRPTDRSPHAQVFGVLDLVTGPRRGTYVVRRT